MFPTIPESLTGLSADQLTALRDEITTACNAYRALAADERTEPEAFIAAVEGLKRVRTALAVLAAEATLSDDPGDDDDSGDGDETEVDDGDDDETEASTIARPDLPSADAAAGLPVPAVARFVAFDNVQLRDRPLRPGDELGMRDLAEALIARAGTINPNTSEKFHVARLAADFGDRPRLSENAIDNLDLWDRLASADREVVAAWCALATPIYDLDCESTLARPVKNSLPNLAAPRARVAVHPSPSLADIVDTAVGIWTIDDDEDDEAVKGPCATIECGTPEEYDVYGVWACMTVKNLLTLNYPELIAQYLNRLGAAHARVGEVQLLNAMATSAAATINTGTLGYGTASSITTQVMEYLALYREQERWDDQPFEMWAHRWLQTAIRIDLSRRNRRDGSSRVATEAEANQVFLDAGVMPHWFIDQPSWSMNLPVGVHTGGVLNALPDEASVLVAPTGKYALMDRGNLTVGVTGNNIYRDTTSNEKNQFTYFFENFEGVVDTGCAPSHILHFQGLCHSGFQIADVPIDCAGQIIGDDYNQDAGS